MSKTIAGVKDEWAKHLRPYGKRRFWKKVRQMSDLTYEDVLTAADAQPTGVTNKPLKKTKRFGIKLIYPATYSWQKEIEWTEWYMTKAARENAMKSKSDMFVRANKERVER